MVVRESVAGRRSARLTLIAILALVGLILIEPSGANAHHPNAPPRLREEYYSSVPAANRIVNWRFCPKAGYNSGYEANIMTIGFNNWKATYGNSIKHTRLADSCPPQNDLVVYAETPISVQLLCGAGAVAYHVAIGSYPGPLGSEKIPYAEIHFDANWIDDIGTSAGADTHVFIHEFGHGMVLGDSLPYHAACGTGAMSLAPRTDTVKTAVPTDLCNADVYGGYSPARW